MSLKEDRFNTKDKPCHADVLLGIANLEQSDEKL